ncbi:MAG: hypothetical protein ABID38_07220 [Candidatus Diapherotrites archaeon]
MIKIVGAGLTASTHIQKGGAVMDKKKKKFFETKEFDEEESFEMDEDY